MDDTQTIPPPPQGYTLNPPPPSGYKLNPSDDSGITQPIASVRTSGDSYNIGDKINIGGQDAYVIGHDSHGKPMLDTVPPPPRGYSVNKIVPPSLPPMSKSEADNYFQTLAAGGTKPYQPPNQPNFAGTALVDPESHVFGEPIKSAIHPDTRGGRNLVPVQDVATTRQQMQYEAAHPDEMAQVAHSQAMDASLPLADRLSNRAGLEARKRTELGQAVSNVNDQWKQFAGNKGADAGEAFAQFMARNFQTENPQATPGEIGAARSVGKNIASTAVDPVTHATIATGGVGGKLAQATVAALFSAGAAKQSYDAAGQLGSIWDRPDISAQQKAEMASDLVLNTAMAGMAGAHAVRVPFLSGADPLLSGIPAEYRRAVKGRINSIISNTGGVLSRAASTAGDVAAEVANTDRENVPTQGVTALRRAIPKVPTASAETALPLIRAVANDAGLKTVTASDLLDSTPDKNGNTSLGLIGQAKNEVLAQAHAAAGPGRTIADMTPQEMEPYRHMFDALDDVHDHIQQAQEDETAELKKAAEKGKIPATKAAALVRMGMGMGKVGISASAGPALGRMSRVLLHAYGIPSGFNDLVTGVKGLIGAGGKLSPTLDENLNAALGRTRPAENTGAFGANQETRGTGTPYQGDTSVQHETNIAPPRQPHGDASVFPDEEYRPLEPTRPQYEPYAGNRRVQHDSAIFPPQTPHGEAAMLPDEPNPRFQLSSSSTAARPQVGRSASTAQRPLGSRQFTSVPAGVTPELEAKQIPLTTSVPSRTVAGSVTAARQPRSLLDVLSGKQAATEPTPRDIFPNDKAMEDWLQQQEDNSPAIQQARQRAQRIRDAREAPAQNPGDIVVPRGQHPESVVERALTQLSLPALREAARAGEIDYSSSDTHQDIIGKIMDAYAGQDEHLSNLAETLQGKRGAVPAGPREKAPVQDEDYTDVMARSVEAAQAKKGQPQRGFMDIMRGSGERRQPDNADIRSRFSDMNDAQKTEALVEAHQRERISKKTGLPNDLAFQESAATLGQTHPHVGFIDVDDFKGANDAFGHVAVDQKILPAIGDAFRAAMEQEPGVQFFHRSGDEFLARGQDPAAITRAVDHVNDILKDAVFTMQKQDGSIVTQKGIGLSHGISADEPTAKIASESDKKSRKLAGLRAGTRDKTTDQVQAVVPPSPQGNQTSLGELPERKSLLDIFGGRGSEPSAQPARGLAPASTFKAGDVGYVDPKEVKLKPQVYQYKLNTNERGVTNQFSENKYNEDLAGVVHVFREPDTGDLAAVNGHHRTDLAQRSDAPRMLIHVLDVTTPEEARAVGALQNIAEGQGTPTDAAKFFRDSGMTPADLQKMGVSLSAAKVESGLALSKLDPSIFHKVATGQMSEGRGVAIGSATDDPAQQEAIMRLITRAENRGKNVSEATVAELARQVSNAGLHVSANDDLFGSVPRVSSLAIEKAEVSAFIKKQLGQEKRVFGSVAKEGTAQTLGRVKGQQIVASENATISQQAAQGLEVYDKLSTYKGPIDTILERAARRLADGDNAAKVKQDAYETIRQEISKAFPGK